MDGERGGAMNSAESSMATSSGSGSGSAGNDAGAATRTAFRVSVTKDYLVFASAHFITFEGHRCEALHGHNYRVGVVLEGGIDPASWYVFDFVQLKRLMKRLCDEIDHRVLLPLRNPRITLGERADGAAPDERELITVQVDGRLRYVFPRSDCALLEIPNTTVEMLAQYLAGRVRAELASRGAGAITAVEVEVEENFGQSAVCREEVAAGGSSVHTDAGPRPGQFVRIDHRGTESTEDLHTGESPSAGTTR